MGGIPRVCFRPLCRVCDVRRALHAYEMPDLCPGCGLAYETPSQVVRIQPW